LLLLAAGAAGAQTPEQVQYLPRDGAALILWMAPQGNVTGYNIYQTIVTDPSTKPADPVKVNAELVKTTSFLVQNLTNGTGYHFRVSAIVDGKETEAVGPFPAQGDLGEYVAVVPQKPVLDGFYGQTIGSNFAGSHVVDANGTITMKASGWDIQSDADGFYLLAKPVSGDVTVTARCVSGPTETSSGTEWNLCGVTIRESLDSRARLAMMQVAREGPMQFKWREEFAGSPPEARDNDTPATTRPIWLRVVRKGNDFSAFNSQDGTTWKQVGDTITIADYAKEAYVGLALSAHDDGSYSTAVFDNFTVTSP
jgi:hypothetical protein